MNFESALRETLFRNEMPYYGYLHLEPMRYQAFNSDGICHKKCCRYRIFEGQVGAHLKCWRRGIDVYWFYKDKCLLTSDEIKKYNKERANVLDLKEKERQEATLQAREEWWKSDDLDLKNSYVQRKKIIPCYARQHKSAILLPIYNEHGEIISNQKIFPDGSKRFATAASYSGGMLFLSEHPTPQILIAEGWATACSIRMATTSAVCVAFNDSNMVNVAASIKRMFPKSCVVICGDKGDSGIKYAKKAAQAVGGIAIIPAFLDGHQDYTDFNDVACLYGHQELERQLHYLKG
jgi:putative DNA primase/helicase